jgi:hypothetical protein
VLRQVEMGVIGEPMDEDKRSYSGISLFDPDKIGVEYFLRTKGWQCAQAKVPLFICPSDDPSKITNPFVFMENFWRPSTSLTAYYYSSGQGDVLGRTNYLGVAGRWGPATGTTVAQWEGIFSDRSRTDFSHMTDGSSNVLMFGEVMGGYDRTTQPPTRRSFAWAGCGVMIADYALTDDPRWYHFSSLHPQVALFSMGDGSVRQLNKSIDKTVFRNLSGMRDGTPAPLPYRAWSWRL